MPGPTLTPDEIQQMQKEAAKATASAATFQSQIAAQNARAVELGKVDSAFKKYFDYYNNDIIAHYDLERKAINGVMIDSPIIEADILAVANLAGGRCQPALPATDIVRIAQFDGTPLLAPVPNELQAILDQAVPENAIVNGYGGVAPAITILTDTAITPTSTTLQLKDLTTTFSLNPNDIYVVANGGNLAVFKIVTFVMQVAPVPPPYIADLTIELIVPPVGTISSGQQLDVFLGFTNAERTTKTPTNALYQPLMDYFVAQIQAKINLRLGFLNLQLPEIAANQDPDATAALAQATTNVNASKTFLTNYLITTDVSNTGLGTLSSERASRTTQANTRVAQIIAAYTGQSKNYYNERYNAANNRANTARGSLRLQKAAEQNASTSAGYASSLTAQAGAINSILP